MHRQKDGVELTDNGKVQGISEDDGYYQLIIRDVKPSDAGLYTCIAKNSNGTTKSATTLRVKGWLSHLYAASTKQNTLPFLFEPNNC